MKNAISWFEIPSTQLDQAQAFYEAVLTCKMRREPMGPSEGVGLQARRKLRVDYHDAGEQLTQRTLRPLGCFYWGKVWTLGAWCESRHDFRSFRLDRMDSVQCVEGANAHFRDEPGKTLADYLRSVAPPQVQAKWMN
jgi:hypothetical protein